MNRIEKAVTKCMVYMEKSLTCDPPAGKISKYTHRLSSVFLDAVHHLNVGKCEPRSAGGRTPLVECHLASTFRLWIPSTTIR